MHEITLDFYLEGTTLGLSALISSYELVDFRPSVAVGSSTVLVYGDGADF